MLAHGDVFVCGPGDLMNAAATRPICFYIQTAVRPPSPTLPWAIIDSDWDACGIHTYHTPPALITQSVRAKFVDYRRRRGKVTHH